MHTNVNDSPRALKCRIHRLYTKDFANATLRMIREQKTDINDWERYMPWTKQTTRTSLLLEIHPTKLPQLPQPHSAPKTQSSAPKTTPILDPLASTRFPAAFFVIFAVLLELAALLVLVGALPISLTPKLLAPGVGSELLNELTVLGRSSVNGTTLPLSVLPDRTAGWVGRVGWGRALVAL